MNNIDITTARKHGAAICCPRCLSIECRLTRIPNLGAVEAIENTWVTYRKGRPGKALRLIIGWGFVEAANALRDPWACDHCGWHFREARS